MSPNKNGSCYVLLQTTIELSDLLEFLLPSWFDVSLVGLFGDYYYALLHAILSKAKILTYL